jgi:hypothetical protein
MGGVPAQAPGETCVALPERQSIGLNDRFQGGKANLAGQRVNEWKPIDGAAAAPRRNCLRPSGTGKQFFADLTDGAELRSERETPDLNHGTGHATVDGCAVGRVHHCADDRLPRLPGRS